MDEIRRDLVISIEQCVLQALDKHKGRSNRKTSVLHGSIQKYINHRNDVKWEDEKTITGNNQSFKIDVYASSASKDIALLMKSPVLSLNKNKKNTLCNAWGEAVRVSLIRKGEIKPLGVLAITFYPTMDIVLKKKTTAGGGSTEFSEYKVDPPEIYNSGFELLAPSSTAIRYVAVPYEYLVPHTLKEKKGVLGAFERIEAGKRIKIHEDTWRDLDRDIDWLLSGFGSK